MEKRFDGVDKRLEKLEVAANANTSSIAQMEDKSAAMSSLFWIVDTVVVTIAITTILESKFHWLQTNWGWMFGSKIENKP